MTDQTDLAALLRAIDRALPESRDPANDETVTISGYDFWAIRHAAAGVRVTGDAGLDVERLRRIEEAAQEFVIAWTGDEEWSLAAENDAMDNLRAALATDGEAERPDAPCFRCSYDRQNHGPHSDHDWEPRP